MRYLLVLILALLGASYGLRAPHPTHPGLWLWSDGSVSVDDPHPELGRTCLLGNLWRAEDFRSTDRFCDPAGMSYVCANVAEDRLEADFHFWLRAQDQTCTYSTETHTEAELRRGVEMNGDVYFWEPSDILEGRKA